MVHSHGIKRNEKLAKRLILRTPSVNVIYDTVMKFRCFFTHSFSLSISNEECMIIYRYSNTVII